MNVMVSAADATVAAKFIFAEYLKIDKSHAKSVTGVPICVAITTDSLLITSLLV